MLELNVLITKMIDDSAYPIIVECELYDAEGEKHIFVDKEPIFCETDFIAAPCAGGIRCKEIARNGNIVTVSTMYPDYVESTEGATEFRVFAEQLINWRDE